MITASGSPDGAPPCAHAGAERSSLDSFCRPASVWMFDVEFDALIACFSVLLCSACVLGCLLRAAATAPCVWMLGLQLDGIYAGLSSVVRFACFVSDRFELRIRPSHHHSVLPLPLLPWPGGMRESIQ